MRTEQQDSGSIYSGQIAKGCEHCINGSKMVLFITGKCTTGCFYCPVSFEKKGKDVIYANEMMVTSNDDIIQEAEMMDATGSGITGGDPLINFNRTMKAVELLKSKFGKDHHIHLYTSTIDYDKAKKLADAGLDEIRFHPPISEWTSIENSELEKISKLDLDVGIEVPALPDHEEELSALISYAEKIHLKFVNLNELEFSESNYDMMKNNHYEVKDETSAAILGSKDTAIRLIESHPDIPIHFCSSTFKDSIQLRNRLKRRAEHIAKEYDVVTDDGTVLKGLIYAEDLDDAVRFMIEEYDVPEELYMIDRERNRIEIAPWILDEVAEELPFKCYIVEEYPTSDRLEVERTPLN